MGKPIFGWGCCISEICAKAVFSLDMEKQNEIFDELFGEKGCGFEYGRLSIGANDFAESWYSYNETEGDFAMENFSIERDRKYILPTVKEAYKRSPDLAFFASPWSPPTWMKFPMVYNYGRLVRTEENLKAYALYFRRFLEAYAKEGVKISAVCPQNEFFADKKFPSCHYSAKEPEAFMCHLVDEVKDLADIYYGTCNGPNPYSEYGLHNEYLAYLMQNPKLRENIKGGAGNNSWDYAMYIYHLIHHYFSNGARANVYWNMALENDGVSTWGWRQNSLISVKDGEFTFNPDFYAIKHFARFVKKGAVLLSVKGEMSSNTTAFKNTDGYTVAVILNPFEFNKTATINGNNYVLKPRSFNTIIL